MMWNINKAALIPPQQKMLTYPEWEEAKQNCLFPKVSINEYRLFSKSVSHYNGRVTNPTVNSDSYQPDDNEGYCGFKPGFLINKRF